MFFKILRILFSKLTGKLKFQKFFEELYFISLKGMNIGGGGNVSTSGELDAIRYIKSKIKENNPILFDVGANNGSYTRLLIDYFNKEAKIFSFEPSFQTYKNLEANVAATNVFLFNFGFGEKNSTFTLYSDKEGSGLSSVYNRRLLHLKIEMSFSEEIEIKTIDSFCEEQKINKVDFLKIDVEGHEMSVLKGACNLLEKRKIQFIQFEFGGCNIDSRTYFQDFYYLLKDNYQLYRIVQDGIFRINNYKEMYEAFMTTNFLAELIEKD